ncbi:hypothetical protein K2X05_03290 [bacterium]|nr:hypothetical protein [bacterium]
MFSYSFYSFFHIMSILTVVISLAITSSHISSGGNKQNLKNRKLLSITHGVALLLAFVAGFGLMARGGFQFSSSHWIHVKILCWFLLGIYPLFLYKKWIPQKMALWGLFAVLTLAVYTVVFKPF